MKTVVRPAHTYDRLAGTLVLDIGIGSGFHTELMTRACAFVAWSTIGVHDMAVARSAVNTERKDRLLLRTSHSGGTPDGCSARFYPADRWRDLLLAFLEVEVGVTGIDTELPSLRMLRPSCPPRVTAAAKNRYLDRFGSFVTFRATAPLE